MRSPLDDFSDQRDLGSLSLLELSKLAGRASKQFWKKMTASSYDPELLDLLAEFIYENARKKLEDYETMIEEDGPEKIDAVILTGDLATTGTVDDINTVKTFLKGPFDPKYPYLSPNHESTLAAVKIPVWYFPGNHDRYHPTWGVVWINRLPFPKFFEPGGKNYDHQFWDFSSQPVRVLGGLSTSVSGGSPLRVVTIAADFSLKQFGDHEGTYGWLAQGKVYDDVLDQLVQTTEAEIANHKQSGSGALCILWAIHFPPEFPHIGKSNRLMAEELLIGKCKQCGVKAILAGHTHEQVRYCKPGMGFEVLCCGTTTQHVPLSRRQRLRVSGGNRFQIITITADSSNNIGIGIENYKYKGTWEPGIHTAYFYKE